MCTHDCVGGRKDEKETDEVKRDKERRKMSVIGGVGERRLVFGEHQWNIARFLYDWHSSHWLASGKKLSIPKGRNRTKSKSNKHKKTH